MNSWHSNNFAAYAAVQDGCVGDEKLIGSASIPTFSATSHLTPRTALLTSFPDPNHACPPVSPVSVSEQSDDAPAKEKRKWNRPRLHIGDDNPSRRQDEGQFSPSEWLGQTSPTAPRTPMSLLSPLSSTSTTGSGGGDMSMAYDTSRASLGEDPQQSPGEGVYGKDQQGSPPGGPKKTTRERNRMAATRYRTKTLRTVADLEAESRRNEKENQSLRASIIQLRGEVLELKSEILRQSDCNCPLMRGYVSAEAQKFVASMAHRCHQAADDSNWNGTNNAAGGTCDCGNTFL
jgi:hypothetical protein